VTVEIGMPAALPPREERDPVVVSNSYIQVFKDCRRKFWLSYYRRLKPKEEKLSGALALGSRVHRALELYYHEVAEDPATEPETLEHIWSALVSDDRLVLEAEGRHTDDFDNEAELGRIMLEGYIQWIQDEGVDSALEIVSQEETLRQEMLGGQALVVGKIDQRVRRKSDGVRFIRDFKTSANFSDLLKTTQMNEQFLLYMVLEAMQKGEMERVEGAIVTALKKVKRTASARPPFYDQIEVQHNIFEMRNFYKRLHGTLTDMVRMWRDLEDGADPMIVAYPRPTRDCSWKCQFNAICPMFDDGSAVEQAIADQFQVGDPYAYYGDSSPTKEK
jgi:hypothetical protein